MESFIKLITDKLHNSLKGAGMLISTNSLKVHVNLTGGAFDGDVLFTVIYLYHVPAYFF